MLRGLPVRGPPELNRCIWQGFEYQNSFRKAAILDLTTQLWPHMLDYHGATARFTSRLVFRSFTHFLTCSMYFLRKRSHQNPTLFCTLFCPELLPKNEQRNARCTGQ